MPILPKLKNHTFLQSIKTHPHKYPFCRNTSDFFNAVNLLILSVFALDALTWFQNGELGRHNMFAYHWALSSTKKGNAFVLQTCIQIYPIKLWNSHSCLNSQSKLNCWTQFPWLQHFLDRFDLQFAFQLDLHRLNSGPDSCGRHALSTNRARGGLLRFRLR